MKAFLTPMFRICFLLLGWLSTFSHAEQEGDFMFTSKGSSIIITKYTGAGGKVQIPNEIAGLPVKSLAAGSFVNAKITTIGLPAGITMYSDAAPSLGGRLESITVDPANPAFQAVDGVLLSKDGSKLVRCPGAKEGSYVVPPGVTSIGDSAFSGCISLTSCLLPEGLLLIGRSAFDRCKALADVNIPPTVTLIQSYAFGDCSSLTTATIPASVKNAQSAPFRGCSNLLAINVDPSNSSYRSVDGVLFKKDGMLLEQYPGGRKGNYVVPDSVTLIKAFAFYGCEGLTGIEIPKATAIDFSVFIGCTALSSFSVEEGHLKHSCVDGILFDREGTTLIQYPAGKLDKTYVIPATIKKVYEYAFAGSKNLTSITISSGLTEFGHAAFRECTGLTEVSLPAGMKVVKGELFFGCTSLAKVTIPASVTSIYNAFYGCNNLTSVVFEGDAPAIEPISFPRASDAPGLKIQYYKGRAGFTSPEWKGLPSVEIEMKAEALAGMPDWKAKDGRSVQGKFIRVQGETVVIEKADSKQHTIPFAKLTPVSVQQAMKLNAAPK